MIVNPYKTSFGSLINIEPVEEAIVKALVHSSGNLNYEYACEDEGTLSFITGKDEYEKELPVWTHPITLKDHKGNENTVIDLRSYVKPTESFTNLSDIVKNKSGYNFTVLRALLTYQYQNGNYGVMRTDEKTIVNAFSYWIADSLNSGIMLNPIEKLGVEIAAAHFYLAMLSREGEIDNDLILNKISKLKLSIPINLKTVISNTKDFKTDLKTIDDLVENIKIAIGGAKTGMVDTNILVNVISNSWFGPGGSETIIISIENPATWISMLYSAANDNTYKRTRLATIVNKYKSKLKLKDFIKNTTNFIESSSY